MSGEAFETHCAHLLELDGWRVSKKGRSGDQGIDLAAQYGDLKVAFQCKRYSQPVGNKAVQEVEAGRQFEGCDLAVVVSNATYTPAARQLASALKVMLIHYSDLGGLRSQLVINSSAFVSGEAIGELSANEQNF